MMSIRNIRKVNKLRNLAIAFIIIGFIAMYAGIYFRQYPIITIFCIIIGAILFIASALIYSMVGMLSFKSIPVICPSCGKRTNMYGKVDKCKYCHEALTLEKELEGKNYDERYNHNHSSNKGNTRSL